MEKYLYLFIDVISFLIPFLFSFNSKSSFYKKWKYLWPAIAVPALLFILWDNWFTGMGIWGFTSRYVIGLYFFHLPIEEVLFFVCIPYACVFTYEAVNHFTTLKQNQRQHVERQEWVNKITWALIAGLMVVGGLNYNRWYTSMTFFITAALLIFLMVRVKPNYLGRFYFAFLFILIPFFILNGVLTGTGLPEPIVWYNDSENLGIRILTIPFEDTFYGMLLILMNVTIFEFLQKRSLTIREKNT